MTRKVIIIRQRKIKEEMLKTLGSSQNEVQSKKGTHRSRNQNEAV